MLVTSPLGHGAAGLARDRQPAVGEVEPHAASVRRQQAQVGTRAAAAVQQTEPGPAAGQPCDYRRHELAEAVKPEVIGLGLMRQVEETAHARDYASSAVRAYLRAARATGGRSVRVHQPAAVQVAVVLGRAEDALHVVLRLRERDVVDELVLRDARALALQRATRASPAL